MGGRPVGANVESGNGMVNLPRTWHGRCPVGVTTARTRQEESMPNGSHDTNDERAPTNHEGRPASSVPQE